MWGFLLGQECDLERGWCLLPGVSGRCVLWRCGQGLLFGLTARAAVINQSALRRGGSAGETLLTSAEPVSGCVMGFTATSFPLPVPLDMSDDAVCEEETCFASW